MLLKRIYDKPKDWTPERNTRDGEGKLRRPDRPEGELLNPPRICRVKVLRAGERQNFSTDLVERAVRDGWMFLGGGEIVLKTEEGDQRWKIVRGPGHYCCLCHERLDGQEEAKRHVALVHKHRAPSVGGGRSGLAKDDPEQRLAQNPAGYERIHQYECVRVH